MTARFALAILAATVALAAAADDRAAYNQRAAERDMQAFHALDRDRDGALSVGETRGDVDFEPRFRDIDINRDGVVTPAEMRRYIEQMYGVKAPA